MSRRKKSPLQRLTKYGPELTDEEWEELMEILNGIDETTSALATEAATYRQMLTTRRDAIMRFSPYLPIRDQISAFRVMVEGGRTCVAAMQEMNDHASGLPTD